MTLKRNLAAATAVVLTAACAPSGSSPIDPNKVTQLTVALSDLEKRVATLEQRVKEMEPPALTMPVNLPDWVEAGSRIDPEKPNLVFGVGRASGITNASLARSAAGEDAKRAILGIIRDEFELTGKGKAARTTLTAITITGVKFTEHWQHPDGTTYALGELNLKAHPQLGIKLKEPPEEAVDDAADGDSTDKDDKTDKEAAQATDGKKRKRTKRKKAR